MRISDWSSDVCSSDREMMPALVQSMLDPGVDVAITVKDHPQVGPVLTISPGGTATAFEPGDEVRVLPLGHLEVRRLVASRSEEHTSELQSLMRISYAVFCWKKKKIKLHK